MSISGTPQATDVTGTQPRGVLGYAQVTAAQAAIAGEVDLTGLTVTVTVGSGRRIKITAHLPEVDCDATAGSILGRIKESTTVLNFFLVESMPASTSVSGMGHVILTPSAGSHTYKLSLNKNTGAGTVTMQAGTSFPASILVEDIGAV